MYKIKVNDSEEFQISEKDAEALNAIEISPNKFHILHNTISTQASVISANFNEKTYTVNINNNTYEVDIYDTLDQQIEALGFEIGASQKISDIKAPMPGLILEINVKEGQEVKENDPLLILEAMKMENVINSPRNGIIKTIQVKKGETVDKNALLIEFEA